jgi:hypothetical protein
MGEYPALEAQDRTLKTLRDQEGYGRNEPIALPRTDMIA